MGSFQADQPSIDPATQSPARLCVCICICSCSCPFRSSSHRTTQRASHSPPIARVASSLRQSSLGFSHPPATYSSFVPRGRPPRHRRHRLFDTLSEAIPPSRGCPSRKYTRLHSGSLPTGNHFGHEQRKQKAVASGEKTKVTHASIRHSASVPPQVCDVVTVSQTFSRPAIRPLRLS